MAKVISLRVPDDLLAWADEYAVTRGVSRTDLLIEGLRSFREDCLRGVPEIREAAPPAGKVERACRVPGVVRASSLSAPSAVMLARQARVNAAVDKARKS